MRVSNIFHYSKPDRSISIQQALPSCNIKNVLKNTNVILVLLTHIMDVFQKVVGINLPNKSRGKLSKYEEDIYSMFNPISGRCQCPRCQKTYSGKSGLSQHYQIHVGMFKYWCDSCRKGFTFKSLYMDHVAKHEGRTFPCDLCDKRLAARMVLNSIIINMRNK